MASDTAPRTSSAGTFGASLTLRTPATPLQNAIGDVIASLGTVRGPGDASVSASASGLTSSSSTVVASEAGEDFPKLNASEDDVDLAPAIDALFPAAASSGSATGSPAELPVVPVIELPDSRPSVLGTIQEEVDEELESPVASRVASPVPDATSGRNGAYVPSQGQSAPVTVSAVAPVSVDDVLGEGDHEIVIPADSRTGSPVNDTTEPASASAAVQPQQLFSLL